MRLDEVAISENGKHIDERRDFVWVRRYDTHDQSPYTTNEAAVSVR